MREPNDPLHRKKLSAIDALHGHGDLAQRLRALADEVEVVLHAGEELELIEIAESVLGGRQAEESAPAEEGSPADPPAEGEGSAEGRPGESPQAADADEQDSWSLPWTSPEPQPWLAPPGEREAS